MFTIGSFRSRTPQICDAAGSNFSQRRLPAHARPFKFDASLSYKTRVKGIWRCVENVSINCPFFKTEWIRMYLLNLKYKTQIHGETFLRKFTLQTWQSWHFLTWYAGYWGWRSEAKMDQIYKIISSKLCLQAQFLHYFKYFTVVFAKRTPELSGTNRIWSFVHGSIFCKL